MIIMIRLNYYYFILFIQPTSVINAYFLDDVSRFAVMLPNHTQNPINIPFSHINLIIMTLYICSLGPSKSLNFLCNQTHCESQMASLHIIILLISLISLTLSHDLFKICLMF